MDFGAATGKYSGRPYDPERIGRPRTLRTLSFRQVRLTLKGIEVVNAHVARFGEDAYRERMMLERLSRARTGGGHLFTPTLKRFYAHELREFVRYRSIGWKHGQPADRDEAYALWNHTHTAALEEYQLREGPGVLHDVDLEEA